MNKNIVIASGDPAGCGPLITTKAIERCSGKKINFFVVGDQEVFKEIPRFKKIKNRINFINLNTCKITKIKKGHPSKLSGYAALSYLQKALEIMKEKKITRLVTAPLSKEAAQKVSSDFQGHTEYLANHFRIKNFAMMMFSEKIKLVLLTRHVPLYKVSGLITEKVVDNALSLVISFLQKKCKIKKPKIALLSVNPHAGVNTFFGKEEKILARVIAKFKESVCGPYPADTIFTNAANCEYDCLVCAYHDQGMIPFKLLSMKNGVNITLGLPIIRTSPAHGVACDAIISNKTLFSSSMSKAIEIAIKIDHPQNQHKAE